MIATAVSCGSRHVYVESFTLLSTLLPRRYLLCELALIVGPALAVITIARMSEFIHHVQLTLAHLIRLELPILMMLRALTCSIVLMLVALLAATRQVVLLRVGDVLGTLRGRRMIERPETPSRNRSSLTVALLIRSCQWHARIVAVPILTRIDGRDRNID